MGLGRAKPKGRASTLKTDRVRCGDRRRLLFSDVWAVAIRLWVSMAIVCVYAQWVSFPLASFNWQSIGKVVQIFIPGLRTMREMIGLARPWLFVTMLMVGLAWSAVSAKDLAGFLTGDYRIIGKRPDSGQLYAGRVRIEAGPEGLRVIRMIGEEKIVATGRVESAAGGDERVLRVRFVQKGTEFEVTYMLGSDLDNHARLSGHVYRRDGATRDPGLEALFSDHATR